jgi:hypothetical protein
MLRTEDQEGQSYRIAVARRCRHIRIRGASARRAVCCAGGVEVSRVLVQRHCCALGGRWNLNNTVECSRITLGYIEYIEGVIQI